MRKRYKRGGKVKKTAAVQGIAACLTFVFLFYLCSGKIDASTFFLNESLPGFSVLFGTDKAMYKFADGVNDMPEAQSANRPQEDSSLIYVSDLVGVNDVDLQPETDPEVAPSVKREAIVIEDADKLHDLAYLKSHFYTVDRKTELTSADFDADAMLNANLSLDMSVPGPKVLIFHTHSGEMYVDSDPGNMMDGVVGVGEKLAEILTNVYGIESLHHIGQYDFVNGKHELNGAYERMEPEVEQIIRDNPSLEVAIDIHRDGLVDETKKLVTSINGVPTAQVMFFNGLCLVNKSGQLVPYSLQNPYKETNLALSFKAQLTANSLYPDFTRKIYLNAYRYSLNMLPKSMLIEVGAQTNTKAEAFNAMGPLAAILSLVLTN
ncbi:MAG: stage II sporulation protein P [Clostridiales bacterium]|jgi:stage II sporulation protein P|nr:stage II sporulation protein P [Clostridiales bacterium]